MSWSAVIEFPAVDATAEVKAAWIAAAESEGDWWAGEVDAPWPDTLVEVTPGQLLAGLAAARVADVMTATGAADRVDPASCVDPNRVDAHPGPVPADLAGWVRSDWWFAPVRDEVRALLTLPPGVELQARLMELKAHGRCPADHREASDVVVAQPLSSDSDASGAPGSVPCVATVDPMGMPVPGSSPGFPCTCQLLVAAAWEACA